MGKYCGKCGAEIKENQKFCPKCGYLLENNSSISIRKNDKNIKIVIAVSVVIITAAICGFAYTTIFNSTGSIFVSETKEATAIESKNSNNAISSDNQFSTRQLSSVGYITGDEVLLRDTPSTSGKQIGVLYKNNIVNLLKVYECNDKSAAILNIPYKNIYVNNRQITIKSGQALQILQNDDKNAMCKLSVGGNIISTIIPCSEIKLLYGEIWYQVRTSSGKAGYVFGKYVAER